MSGSTESQTGDSAGDLSTHVGFCALLGLPNAGKSTLLNRVLGRRLSAVSRKPQTTRNRIRGVHNRTLDGDDASAQIIFVDTPGIQKGTGALRGYMRTQSLGAVGDSDVSLLIVDVSDRSQRAPQRFRQPDTQELMQALENASSPVFLALNKIDTLSGKEALLPILDAYAALDVFDDLVPIAAKTGAGVSRLIERIGRALPVGDRLFPEDMITDRAEKFLAGELIREQLFRQLGQELPYATAVVVESLMEFPGRDDVTVSALIYVERESQTGIVIGKGGRRIKEVGTRSRAAITELFGCPVHVKLHVKVANNWTRLEQGIRRMGYE